jgi:hypothetical protein
MITTIKGTEMHSVSDDEVEEADYVVCMKTGPSLFIDFCSKCNAEIISRPYTPRELPKLCLECALELAPQNSEGDDR